MFSAPAPGRCATIALVVALVVALLACHGAYGFEHQLAEHQPAMVQGVAQGVAHGSAHPAQPGPMDTHRSPPKGGDTGQGAMPNGGYFAVLISTLLVMVVGSRRGGLRVPDAREAPRVTTRTLAPPVPCPPRGPTLYLFQVMRL